MEASGSLQESCKCLSKLSQQKVPFRATDRYSVASIYLNPDAQECSAARLNHHGAVFCTATNTTTLLLCVVYLLFSGLDVSSKIPVPILHSFFCTMYLCGRYELRSIYYYVLYTDDNRGKIPEQNKKTITYIVQYRQCSRPVRQCGTTVVSTATLLCKTRGSAGVTRLCKGTIEGCERGCSKFGE